MISKILVAGGTGLVGSNLLNLLKQKKYDVIILTTQSAKANGKDILYWNPEKNELPFNQLLDIDYCINLCGKGIFDENFTPKRKKELLESRVKPIQCLMDFFSKQTSFKGFISATAIGIYPNICLTLLDENSTKGSGFVSDLVQEWESTINKYQSPNFNTCILRLGIVFSDKGGFLSKLSKPIRLFMGAIPGSGKQYVSWIHIDDLSNMFVHAIENQLTGTYNAVAPQPNTLENISKQIAKRLNRPSILPHIPVFVLKLLFGSERHELLLSDQQVKADKIQSTGFTFSYQTSEQAIKQLL